MQINYIYVYLWGVLYADSKESVLSATILYTFQQQHEQ